MATIDIVKGMTEANGTEVRDYINLTTAAGNGIVINAYGGNDIINVTKGDKHKINAGAGNDFIEVAGGTGHTINLAEGDDVLKTYGGNSYQISGIAGLNKITISGGSGHVIYGGVDVDNLVIKGDNSNITADLGDGNDIINLATGIGNKVHAGAGNDQIIISGTGGENNYIYGDDGNDSIKAYKGINNTIDAGAGDDAILITDATKNTIYGGSGKNQAMFMGGSDNVYYGGDEKDNVTIKSVAQSVTVNAGTGITVVNIQAGNNHIINLGDGESVTQIMAGENIQVTGGKNKDTFRAWGTVAGLKADLGAGNDKINVDGGNGMTIKGGAGDDQFVIANGNTPNTNNVFEGGDGKDTFSLWGGVNNTIDAGAGDDIITLSGVVGSTIMAGTGHDNITISNGKNNTVVGAEGNDTFKISGGQENIVEGGVGDDNYIVEWAKCGDKNVIIQTTASIRDKDTLIIKDKPASDFAFSLNDNILTITEKLTGKKLEVRGWKSGMNSITFSDRTLSGDELFKDLFIDDGQNHGAVKLGTASLGNLSGYSVTLDKGSAGYISAAFDTKPSTEGSSSLKVNATDNKVVINSGGKVYRDVAAGLDGDVKTAYVESGTAKNNEAVLNGGTVQRIITAAAVEYGSASDNAVTILSGSAQTAYGAMGTNASADNNQVIVQGGKVNIVYGGFSETNEASGNDVTLKGGIVQTVYGGYSRNGSAADNSVNIGGEAIVERNVYANNSDRGTVGAGTVTVSDNAQIKGTLFGAKGVDTITIDGGSVNVIDGKEDNDVINVNGGTVNRVLGGGGDDNVTVTGGTVGSISGEAGDDTITITGGTITSVDGQNGNDHIIVEGGSVDQLNGGVGSDTITVTAGTVSKLSGGDGNDIIEYKGGSINIIEGGAGNDSVTIDWEKMESNLVIDQSTAGNSDTDILKLDNVNSEEFRFFVQNGSLLMKHEDGKVIEIKGWTRGTDSVTFADKTMTGEEFLKKLIIDDGEDHGKVVLGQKTQGSLEDYSLYLIDGSTSELVAAKAEDGAVLNNKVLISGGQISGEGIIAAGITSKGNASGNLVSLTGAEVDLKAAEAGDTGYVVGGKTAQGVAENNQVLLEGGSYDAVYGGWASAAASGNTVTIGGNSVISSEVVGGLTSSGIAENNTITLKDEVLVQGDVYINKVAAGGSGATGDGVAIIQDKVEIKGTLYGGDGMDTIELEGGAIGTIDGGGGDNTIAIKGGSVTAISGGDGVDTITVEGGAVDTIVAGEGEDVITFAGGAVNRIEGGAGKDTFTIEWAALNNNIILDQTSAGAKDRDVLNIENANSEDFSFSLKNGVFIMIDDQGKKLEIQGWDNGMNSITFADKTLAGDDFFPVMDKELVIADGADHGEVRFAETVLAEKSGYTIKLLDGTANKVYTVYDMNNPEDFDPLDYVTANNNSIIVGAGGELQSLGENQGKMAAAYIVNGSASNNTLTLNGGMLDGKAAAVEICHGAASENTVNVNNGVATAIYGAMGEAATISNNKVNQTGGNITALYGGSSVSGVVSGNQVNVTGGTVATVFGGYTDTGVAENNSVLLSGEAVVSGDVYTNFSENGTLGAGNVTVDETAQVQGTIYGSKDVDTITINAGIVNAIDGQGGQDIIAINGGEVNQLTGGAGEDSITLSGGTVGKLYGGADNDTITIAGGKATLVDGGIGVDTVLIEGGKVEELTGGEGADNITMAQGEVTLLNGGVGSDNITINGGKVEQLSGGDGNDTININGGTITTVQGGLGKDTIVIDWNNFNDQLVIDQTTAGSSDDDVLKLNNINSEDFIFDLNGDTLTLTDGDGKQLFIKGWGQGTNSLTFEDKTLSGDELFEKLIIKDGKEHGVITLSRAEQGENSGHTVIIDKGTVKDTYAAFDISSVEESGTAGMLTATENEVIVNTQGKVSAATQEGLEGDIIAAYVVNGTASDNKATLNGGSVDGALVAAKVVKGIAEGNVTTVNSGTASAVYGAQGVQAEVKDNTLVMQGGEITAIYGGSSDQGKVSGNRIEMTGGTADNVYGGAAGSGMATENSVSLSGTATINENIYASYSETGNTGTSFVTVTEDAQVKGSIVGGVGVDTVTISGGKVNKIESEAGKDIINIQGGQVQTVNGGAGEDNVLVEGGQIELLDGGVDGDVITLAGGEVTKVSGGVGNDSINISGGFVGTVDAGTGKDTITVDWDKLVNTVVIDQTTADNGDQDIIEIVNGKSYDYRFSLDGDTLVIVDDEDKHTLKIKGWGQGTNSITFEDRTLSGDDFFPEEDKKLVILDGKDHGEVKFASFNQGVRFGYIVKLVDGSADNVYTVYDTSTAGTNNVIARDNTLLIGAEGTVAQEAAAAYVSKGAANGNVASLEAGSVGNIYAAKGNSAEIYNNTTRLESGSAANVYGGASVSGSVHNNNVVLKGDAVVTGNVYANYSESGTTGDGKVTVDDQVQIQGAIIGGAGVDTVTVRGGLVNQIDTKNGNDVITVAGGQVEKILLTAGEDVVNISGGEVEQIALQSDTSVIKVAGGTLDKLDVTNNHATIEVTAGAIRELQAGSINIDNGLMTLGGKASTVTVIGGSIEQLSGNGNMKVLNSKLEATNILTGAAAEQITIENSILGGLEVGEGNDTISITKKSQVGSLKLIAGNNNVSVNNSTVEEIQGGSGLDSIKVTSSTITIKEGNIDTLTFDGSDNVVNINDTSVNSLKGGSGKDVVNLSNASVTLYKGYGSSLEEVHFIEGDNRLIVGDGSVVEAVTGGTGYDVVEISGGSVALTEGAIENLEITKTCTVNVNGAEVENIALEDGSGWNSVKVNVNSGTVDYIDASNSRATISANGGVIDVIEGNIIKNESNGTVNVDSVRVIRGDGKINKIIGRDSITLTNGSVGNIYGSDANNTIKVNGTTIDTLGTGEGQDTVTINGAKIQTLIVSGDMSTVDIGSSNQWGQEDNNTINKLIMEGGNNTVSVNNNSSAIKEIVGNGTKDVVTIGGGEVKISGGVVEVLRIKSGANIPQAHIILDGGSIGMLSTSGSGGKTPIIDFINGSVGGISVAYANGERITSGAMSFTNADSLGEIRGGYSSGENAISDSHASINTITIKDCKEIDTIYAAYVENVSGLVTTSAGSNEAHITGSTTVNKVYAAYMDAAFTGVEANGPFSYSNYNKVYLNDTNSILKAGYICAAYGKDTGFAPSKAETSQSYCHMSYNIVDISTKYATLGVVYAAYSDNSPGRLTLNEVKLKGSKEGSLTIDKIYSGFATNFGNVGSTWMTGNENKVTATDVTSVNELYAGAADIGANAMLNIGTYTDVGRALRVYAGYADCAEAQYNTLNLTNVNYIEELYGGYNTCVNIGITYKNTVKLNNAVSVGKLCAGYTDANCTFGAYENKIFVTDSTIEELYVSFNASTSSTVGHSSSTDGIGSSNGGCENNLVALLGNSVATGDVYVNYASSVGNSEKNRLYVGGNSQVKGTIRGNGKTDIVKIAGGSVQDILVGSGEDLVRISDGSVNKLDGAGDNDKLLVTGGSVVQLLGGYGQDTIVVDYSDANAGDIAVAEINAGADNDVVIVKGAYEAQASTANTIQLGSGVDYLKLSADNCKGAYGGDGNDVIVVKGNNNIIRGDAGKDVIKLEAGANNQVLVGTNNDTVVLTKTGIITDSVINYASGSDEAYVLLSGGTLADLNCIATEEGCTLSWDSNSVAVTGDEEHKTIIYCDDGYIYYDASNSSYTKSTSATYSGDALDKLAAAESAFTTADYAISGFDGSYFRETELKVTGNA